MLNYKKRVLKAKIQSLSDENLISETQKKAIFERFDLNESENFSLLSVFAFIFIALGLLLFVAFNWQYLSALLKTSFLLLLLLSSHLALLYFKDKNANLAQALGVLSNFILLANLALLSQIYHLSNNAPLALFSVGVASLILAFALGSFVIFIQAYLFYFVGFCWGISESVFYASFGLFILLAFALCVFYESRILSFLNFIFLVLHTLYSPLFADFNFFTSALFFLSFIFLSLNFRAYKGYFYFALSLALLIKSAQVLRSDLMISLDFLKNSWILLLFTLILLALNFYKKRYFLGIFWLLLIGAPFLSAYFYEILTSNHLNYNDFSLASSLIYSLASLAFSIYLFRQNYKILSLLSLCALACVRYFDLLGDYLGASVIFLVFGFILLIFSFIFKRQNRFKQSLLNGGKNEK